MIAGKLDVHLEDDQTDRIGIRTLVLSQMWQASRWPMSFAELKAEQPSAPEMPGGLWLVGTQTRRNGGVLRTFWTFEGVDGSGKDVTFKTRNNSPDWGFEEGFTEAPIQRHPKIGALLDRHDGQVIDNEIIWPREARESGGGSGLAYNKSARASINPMFGRDTYFAFLGATYWYRYAVLDERAIPSIIGRLFQPGALPGRAPAFAGRNYLGAGAPFVRRGPVVEVKEIYWLSDEGGWPKAIYGGGSYSSDSGGGTSGGSSPFDGTPYGSSF